MPCANRVYSAGNIWHITHRCHRGEYLLKCSKDRLLACDDSRRQSIPLIRKPKKRK